MIEQLKQLMQDVSLTKEIGRIISDKSYAYDTIFFIGNYIKNNLQKRDDGSKYFCNSSGMVEDCKRYTQRIFKLDPNADGSQNYLSETINVFLFSNFFKIEKQISDKCYVLINEDLFNWVIMSFENSYIFLYVLVYLTLKNDDILELYNKYLNDETTKNLQSLHDRISDKSISIRSSTSQWSEQITKYLVLVLGYANSGKVISRTFNIKSNYITAKDVSINLSGTKTKEQYRNKNNAYIETLSLDYIQYKLGALLILNNRREHVKEPSYSIYSDLASQVIENIKLTEENIDLSLQLEEEKFSSFAERKIKSTSRKGPGRKYSESLNKIKKEIGDSGEKLVFEYEKEKLKDTVFKPAWVSNKDDTLGYDIISYDLNGKKLHIEVKTQPKGKLKSGDFYLSANEKEQLDHDPNYVIYFVFEMKKDKAKFIQITKETLKDFFFDPVVFKIRFTATK